MEDGREKQRALVREIQSGGDNTRTAHEALFENVRGFCAQVARKYTAALRCPDETDDLLQESYFAMIEAANSFDITGECPFVQWLNLHLHRRFRSYIGQQYGLSSTMIDRRSRIMRFEREFMAKYSREPSSAEICQGLHMKPETVRFLRQIGHEDSLDRPVDLEDGTVPLGDLVPDPRSLEDEIVDQITRENVRQLLQTFLLELDETERRAAKLYYVQGRTAVRSAELMQIPLRDFEKIRARMTSKLRNYRHKALLGRWLPERLESSAYGRGKSTERTALRLFKE